jgi:hypothetical protein
VIDPSKNRVPETNVGVTDRHQKGEGPVMSDRVKGFLGAVAVLATCGAAQLASGEDLTVGLRSTAAPSEEVNRAAKADRDTLVPLAAAQTRTISIQLDRLPNTSILVRIPLAQQARNVMPPRLFVNAGERKPVVACEPSVSVLTEIAKLLPPGRCVT